MSPPDHPNAAVLREAQTTFAAREAAANASVVLWRTGRAPRASLLPLHDEREHPHSRSGSMHAKRRPPGNNVVEYGYDAEGRLRVARAHAMRGQKGLLHELTIVEHTENETRWSVHHESHARAAREVGRLRSEAGAPVEAHVFTPHASITEQYHRDTNGHITAIDVHRETHASGKTPKAVVTQRFTVERNPRGEVLRVYVEHDAGHTTTYQRPSGDREASAQALVDALVAAILRLAARPADAEAAFALAVSWSGTLLPPFVSLGLVSDRSTLSASGPDYEWAPAEWSVRLDVHADVHVQDACAELYAACPLPEDERFIVDALRRVAAALRAHDLAKVLPVTADFTVIAVDVYLEELERALRDARAAPNQR